MAAIDFLTFSSLAPVVSDAGFPVLICGRHGIGKSELVYQFAHERGLTVVERRASQMTEGDLLGLPSISGDSTRWNAPDWLKMACENPVVLFLDEVDRACIEVRQGIFELTDSRKLNGWHLHPQTRIFAAINGGDHAAASSYQVGEMDPAELSRWTTFVVEPTVADWLTWAKDKVDSLVWDFVNNNHAHLEFIPGAAGFEPNKVYPTRRSWVRLNKTVVQAGLLEDTKQNLGALYNLANAFVGFEAAVAFRDFCEKYERMVTIEDILDHGQVEKTAAFGINDHLALVEKLEASGRLDSQLSSTAIQNMADWFVTLPSEVAMKLFAHIGEKADNANIIAFYGATASTGKTVQQHVIDMVA
jgi:MoxR-like ATPase